jgi:hypothetical protein
LVNEQTDAVEKVRYTLERLALLITELAVSGIWLAAPVPKQPDSLSRGSHLRGSVFPDERGDSA